MKKRVSVLLVFLLLASLFAACSGSAPADSGAAAEPAAPAESGAAAPADAGDPLAGAIEFWGWNDDEQNTMAVKAAYEAEFPGRVINVTIVPVREYPDKLTAAMAANTEIDAMCINGNADYAQLVTRNQLLNLDEKLAADGFDLSIYGDHFDEVKYEGSVYSLPYRSSVWVVAFNKNLFDEKGVPYPTDDMTWAQIQELGAQMTSGEGTEKIYGLHYHNRNDDYLQVAYQNGFTLLSDDFTYVREGMQLKLDAMEKGISLPHSEITATGLGVRQPFEQEVHAMYFTADWTINQMRQSLADGVIDFSFDFIAMPHLDGKPAGQTHGSWIHTSVNAKSEKQDAAYEFVKYFGGVPGATIYAAGGTLPAAKYHPDVQAAFIGDRSQDPENIDALFEQTVFDPSPIVAGTKEISDIFLEESELVFIGEKSIDDAIASIQERRAEVLAG